MKWNCRVLAAAIAILLIFRVDAALAALNTENLKAMEDRSGTAEVRPESSGMRVVRAQILLDRARFSPGEIDGRYGGDLGVAVKGYQEAHDLTPDGIIGPQMWKLLNEDERALVKSYTITAADVRGP